MLYIRRLLANLLILFPLTLFGFATPINITVESDWGSADTRDVEAVLNSAAEVMAAYTGGRTLDDIVVRNDSRGPISLYERGDYGEYVVLLDVKGRYWSQLAYQFSHETCHLLSNYDLAPNNITNQQWFEESLCEAFSLFTLERMAVRWQDNPPYPNWKDYAPELQKYVDNMEQQKHRSFAPQLSDWYQQQKAALEENPYAQGRKLNEKIAAHLLSLFNEQPQYWAAINYLNLGEDTDDKSLAKYLNDWYENTPETYRNIVVQIQQLLGEGSFSKQQEV